jgi:hypothetical protein
MASKRERFRSETHSDRTNPGLVIDFHFFLRFISHGQRIVVETLIQRVAISQMKPSDAEATKVLDSINMEAAYLDRVAEKEAIHRNSYQALFEAGALEPLMQFLAKREIVQGTM